MRDPDRIDDVIEQIRITWHAAPDLRLGQLICNAMVLSGQQPENDEAIWNALYNIEDPMMSYGLGKLFAMVAKDAMEDGEE